MGEMSAPHFSCFVRRSVRRCPYRCSIIKDSKSLPSSLARIKFLQAPSQKQARQILISPLKNLNYHNGNRKVIQQPSLSASPWASTCCWALGAVAQGTISAVPLTMGGADFQRSQGYAQKHGIGTFLLRPPEALEVITCGNVTRAEGMVSEQGGSPQLATLPFCSSLS